MTPDLPQHVAAVIELLERVRPVPQMYMIRHDPDFAVAFLSGVQRTAESLLGVSTDGEVRYRVWEDHGWRVGARGPLLHMETAGLTDEAFVDELIAMEIEVWRRVAAKLSG